MPGKFIRYLKGYLRIRIESPLPERFLNLCAFHGIILWGLAPAGDAYEMYISVKDFFRIKEIVRKTRTKIRIRGHYGMPFFFQKYGSRKVFPLSVLLALALIWVLTLFIWQIQVTGLKRHSPEEIITFLKETNVQYGMAKSRVDCQKIEADIRAEFQDIIWVGASLEGTNLHIQIKENVDSYEEEEPHEETADLVAEDAGTVVSIITRTGTPMVCEGQQVEKGQILISGREERKDDGGTVTGYAEGYADGDVLLERVVNYEDHIAYRHEVKTYSGKKKRNLTVRILKKELRLLSGKPSFSNYDTETTEKTLVIGKTFFLPISYRYQVMKAYDTVTEKYTREEAKDLANRHFQAWAEDFKKKGVEIIENRVKIVLGEKECVTSGQLTVVGPAGTHRPSEPLENTSLPLEEQQ